MSIKVQDLSAMQLDALREVGNMGAGNAATAFSILLNKRVDMTVPQVALLPFDKVADSMGGAESLVAGVYLEITGGAPGKILFILPSASALGLVDMLTGSIHEAGEVDLSDMDQSALMEIGNILTGSYLNSLSAFTGLTLLPSVPALAYDMVGALMNEVLVELGEVDDYALIIETEFYESTETIKGHFFLIPSPGSLQIILDRLGVSNL